MSAFGGLVLTNRGRILQSKAQTGAPLHYTRIALGDGFLGTTSILELNQLVNEVKSLSINKLKVLGEGRAVVGGVLTNQEMTEGFYFREIGVFATDPDIGEVLYCYGNAGDLAEYIPASGSDVIEKSIDIQTVIGNASNVTAEIDSSLVWETVEGAQQKADNAEANSKEYAEQAIKLNVVDTLTSTETEKALSANQGRILNENLTSLEQDYMSHKADKSNPHNVTSQQVNVISSRPVSATSQEYPRGISTFFMDGANDVNHNGWVEEIKNTVNATHTGMRIFVVTNRNWMAFGCTQEVWVISNFANDNGKLLYKLIRTQSSISEHRSVWGPWRRVLTNEDYDELFQYVSDGKVNKVGTAITDVDPSVVIADADGDGVPTFQELADAIRRISTGKKWASGTVAAIENTPGTNINQYEIIVSNIKFKPKVIVAVTADGKMVSYAFDEIEPLGVDFFTGASKEFVSSSWRNAGVLCRITKVGSSYKFQLGVPYKGTFNWRAYE